jgi:hypothetical protein
LHIELPIWIRTTAFAVQIVCAAFWGRRDEHWISAGFVVSAVLTSLTWDYYHPVAWHLALADLPCLVIAIYVALTSRNYWTLAAASIQSTEMLIHLAKMFAPSISAWGYISGWIVTSLYLNCTIATGSLLRRREWLVTSGTPDVLDFWSPKSAWRQWLGRQPQSVATRSA